MNLQHGKLLKLEKYNDYFVRFQIVLFRILGLIMFYCNKEILINREKSGKCKITKDRRYHHGIRVRVMVFKATFNNISVILRLSVLLVEKTGIP